jgi:hypothetical protein
MGESEHDRRMIAIGRLAEIMAKVALELPTAASPGLVVCEHLVGYNAA